MSEPAKAIWPDTRILDLFGIEVPILQAPMAGFNGADLAIAVSEAGGLGALPCALLDVPKARAELGVIRQRTDRPVNLNFFCHTLADPDPAREAAWRRRLAPYYAEFGIDPQAPLPGGTRRPFDEAMAEVVEEFRPEVVSFHFGLPRPALLQRVRAAGARIVSSATTVAEARWLADAGCDAIIAQGAEAGGHRGMFLDVDIATQMGTFSLVPQVVDAVPVPVIAAGGIADARGVAAAFALGASAVQIGTAYLLSPEAKTSALHRRALQEPSAAVTALTNLFSGRPARGIVNRFMREAGPMNGEAPAFPFASAPLAPVREAAEKQGSGDFSPLWAGQSALLARGEPAADLTRRLASEALQRIGR